MSTNTEMSPTSKLGNVLFKTFVVIMLGAFCKYSRLIKPEDGHMKAVELFVGTIAFPLLVFETVANSNVGAIDVRLILACMLGKLSVMVVTMACAYVGYNRSKSKGQRVLTSTVFGLFVTASNDFAIGFPVIDALYGPGMKIYLSANALVQAVLFQPFMLVLFEMGQSMKAAGEGLTSEGGRCHTLKDILRKPMIVATLLGAIANIAFSRMGITELPSPLSDVVKILTAPFGTLALFMTGVSLTYPKMSTWTCVLVLMKVFICAYLSYMFALCMGKLPEELQDFSFFYGSIPTSSAPLVFAKAFDESAVDIVATSILLGLGAAGPNMLITALFLDDHSDMSDVLASAVVSTGYINICFGIVFIVLLVSLLCSAFRLWTGLKVGIAVYAIVACLYSANLLLFYFIEGACESVSMDSDWYPFKISFNTLQKACVFLIFYLRYKAPMFGKIQEPRSFACLYQSLLVGAFCVIPGIFTQPRGLRAVCREEPGPTIQELVVSIILFIMTISLIVHDFIYRRRHAKTAFDRSMTVAFGDSQDNDIAQGTEIAQMGSTAAGAGTVPSDQRVPPATRQRSAQNGNFSRAGTSTDGNPSFTIRTLFRFLGLRILLQIVNTTAEIYHGFDIKGSKTQMLIIESVLEHSQMVFLMQLLLIDGDFKHALYEITKATFHRMSHRHYHWHWY